MTPREQFESGVAVCFARGELPRVKGSFEPGRGDIARESEEPFCDWHVWNGYGWDLYVEFGGEILFVAGLSRLLLQLCYGRLEKPIDPRAKRALDGALRYIILDMRRQQDLDEDAFGLQDLLKRT